MSIMVEHVVDINDHGFKMTIEDMSIQSDKALLFDDSWIVWGEMQLEGRRRDNSTDTFVQYHDKFLGDDAQLDDVVAFNDFLSDQWPEEVENPDTVLGGVHPTYLYVIEDIKVIFDTLDLEHKSGGYKSIEAMLEGKAGTSQADMKFGYFFDGTHILEEGRVKERAIKAAVFVSVGIPTLVGTTLFLLCGIFLIKDTADKITRGVI
jgi:hypothetical protein